MPVILNLSSSPYHLGKGAEREQMLATRARDDLVFVVYCNLVGGQDELLFDGASVAIAPDGRVLARGAAFAEDLLVVDLDVGEAVAARLRDTRPRRDLEPLHADVVLPSAPGGSRAPLASEPAEPPASVEAELWAALRVGLQGRGANRMKRGNVMDVQVWQTRASTPSLAKNPF